MKGKNREIYSEMKKRKISTLDFHHMLNLVGVEIPKRTLQHYLDYDFKNSKNENLKKVALKMIGGYDELVEQIKKEII